MDNSSLNFQTRYCPRLQPKIFLLNELCVNVTSPGREHCVYEWRKTGCYRRALRTFVWSPHIVTSVYPQSVADEFEGEGDRNNLSIAIPTNLQGKSRRISNKWIANLKWARNHCDSLVRVVIIQAEDVWRIPGA
jgi:hypothetical protein